MNKVPNSSELPDARWLAAIMNLPVPRPEVYQEARNRHREIRRRLEDLHEHAQETHDLW